MGYKSEVFSGFYKEVTYSPRFLSIGRKHQDAEVQVRVNQEEEVFHVRQHVLI